MSEGREYKRSRRAWELAGRQHGVVARRQLLALGFNSREIEHRVSRGRLHLVMRGVYAVGWPRLTPKRRWMAAVLACGEEAMLSHRSAAALWEIGTERRGLVDISVPVQTLVDLSTELTPVRTSWTSAPSASLIPFSRSSSAQLRWKLASLPRSPR